ncbi:MAG: nucleoside triphosphate pyrophosphohydrolase [Alphaproteobacteria bacterium]|nr:nucleoside triphosphate pyrophosphohydrolase [Alphaproteobacteria bacterium]
MTDRAAIDRLLEIMARLRDPAGGCPWDIEQTFATIAPYTIEEAYEVADAIERGDLAALKDELGDLLLQVVFHAQMAAERRAFAFADVAHGIADKLIRRHPHVFGAGDAATPDAVVTAWEDIKAAERAAKAETGATASALDGVARSLPALTRAEKLQKRAARAGFDWPDAAPVVAKIEEEINELRAEMKAASRPGRIAEELGDLLFACVNLARHLDVDPEAALRDANAKFERRFRHIETTIAAEGRDTRTVSLDRLDALWDEAKRREKSTGGD